MGGTNYGKYHSKKLDTPDGKFDSKKEYQEWLKLKALEKQGLITDLERQVGYVLIPAQYNEKGKLIEYPCSYVADFVYKNQGIEIVEDVKGFKTPEYVIKRKLMLKVHGIRITEV